MTAQPRLIRDRPWLARFCLACAAFAPAVLLASVSNAILPRELLTEIAEADATADEAPAVLTALMSDMANMAIGLMLAAWFIYRRPVLERAEGWHLGFVLMATGFGLASIFAGLRGEYALAFVISTQPFRLDKISGFIETQSVALVLQFMTTSLLASHFLIFRDRRTTLDA